MARMSLSGFLEQLPEGRIIRMHVLDELRRVFELHGLAGIETRMVETLEQLEVEDETSKEIYVLERLQTLKTAAAGARAPEDKDVGLHFDLTVPFARYAVENVNRPDLPFKRYQIQKAWRGEHPQDSRSREFTQTDIDVVSNGEPPFHFKAGLPLVMAEALNNLPISHVRVLVNNCKIVQGVCESLGVTGAEAVLRGLDKIDKISPEGAAAKLTQSGIDGDQASILLQMVQTHTSESSEVRACLVDLDVGDELLDEGLKELTELPDTVNKRTPGAVVAGLKIAHGPDYYAGSVYELKIEGHKALGSICSGGHYDSLAKDGECIYPGVGLSIGVLRLVSRMISAPVMRASRKMPTAVVVAVIAEDQRERLEAIAAVLRSRGISTDVIPSAMKSGKQTKFADKRGILLIRFPNEEGSADTVKDIRSSEQVGADSYMWVLSGADAVPTIEKVTD